MDSREEKSAIRFLSFSNQEEDAEKEAKLRDAAAKIEQAIAREKSLNELVDYKEPTESEFNIDLANDNRSLYERLQEQRDKKKESIEESKKLSNFVSKLDEDDANYLNEIAKRKRDEDIRNRLLLFEERKRLEEKRIAEEEIKLKESLKRPAINNDINKFNKSNSSIKSKLSSIRIKPKVKLPPDTTSLMEDKHETIKSSETIRSKTSSDKNTSKTEKSNHEPEAQLVAERKDSVADINSKRVKLGNTSGSPKRGARGSNSELKSDGQALVDEACYCKAKNIAKTIGILPSLPQVSIFEDSSDESDEYIDNSLERSLVPKLGKRKHRK